jgi:hydroxyacylglutathione hydrolase
LPKEAPVEVFEDGSLRLTKVGPLGPYANNAYVIADREAAEAVIVDMPAESSQTLEAARGLRVVAVLLTHTHPDHWPEYDLVKGATDAPVLCHPAERGMPAEKIDRPLADGDRLGVGGLSLLVIHTPGHTPGSCCFLLGRYLIAGDTLFPGGPGHSNSPQELQQNIASITERLYTLPGDTLVLPGHGDNTTIEQSRQEYAVFASRPHPPDLHGDVLWESS